MSISRCVTRRTCGQRRDEPQLTQFRAIWQLRSTSTEKNAYVYSDCATRLGHLQRKKRTAVLASGDPRQRRRHHNATLRPIAIDGVSESARDWYRDAPPRFGGEHSGRAASRRNPVLRTRHLEPAGRSHRSWTSRWRFEIAGHRLANHRRRRPAARLGRSGCRIIRF